MTLAIAALIALVAAAWVARGIQKLIVAQHDDDGMS